MVLRTKMMISTCVLVLLLSLQSLLAATLTDTSTTTSSSSGGGRLNTSAMFAEITKDLEEIRHVLQSGIDRSKARAQGTISNLSSTYGGGRQSLDEKAAEHIGGHYLLPGEENKDRPWVLCSTPTDGDSIYKYSISHLNQSKGLIDFAQFRGKPVLIVNVATFCESTIEYPLYNQLKEKFGDQLVIVAFPCNQFLNQEPTSDAEEIYNAIKYVRPGKGFIPAFPITKRIEVNGENTHSIYSFLKRACPSTRTRFSSNEQNLLYKPKNARDIRWNFEKFLIHPTTGQPWKRYDQKFLPDRITADIEALLEETKKAEKV